MTTRPIPNLEHRLAQLHSACLQLVQEISLDSLLNRIARIACDQAWASYAVVAVVDDSGRLMRIVPALNPPGATPEEAGITQGLGLIEDLVNARRTIRVSAVSEHHQSPGFPAGHAEMTSFLGVPLWNGSRHLGQIYLADKVGEAEFNEGDEKVIETLAAYAAVAIANARLYQEISDRDNALTRRNADLALLNDLATTLAITLDSRDILEKSLDRVMANPRITVGEVYIVDDSGTFLERMHVQGRLAGDLWVKDRFALGEGPIGGAAREGIPQFTLVGGRSSRFLKSSLRKTCLKQVACFPFSIRGSVIGVLSLAACQEDFPDETEVNLYTAIGSWVGTAIDNIRLFSQGRRLAILEERERIGMDLHDGVIQSIYAVGLTLEHARLLMPQDTPKAKDRIDQAIDDLNHTIRDIRAYILDLKPRQLHEENLMDGIRRLMAEFKSNTRTDISLTGPEEGFSKLPQVHALALFHICQEALANIAKHAHASQVTLTLWNSPDRVLLEVRDDGRGFDQEKTRLTLGHGLANIHTRARNVGGDVEITSEPGDGTTILAWVPYQGSG